MVQGSPDLYRYDGRDPRPGGLFWGYLASRAICPGTFDLTYDADEHQVVYHATSPADSTYAIEIGVQVNASRTVVVTNTPIIDSGTMAYGASTAVILNGSRLYLPLVIRESSGVHVEGRLGCNAIKH